MRAIASSIFGQFARPRGLQVVDLGRRARAARDLDRLVDRLEQVRAFAAHVRHVDAAAAAPRSRRARRARRSRRRCPARRSARSRRRARPPPSPAHDVLHRRELFRRRIHVLRRRADSCARSPRRRARRRSSRRPCVSSVSRYSPSVVHSTGYLRSPCCATSSSFIARRERAHRIALAHHLERHALAQLALAAAVDQQRLVRPGQHVDEAGRDGAARSRRSRACALPGAFGPT